MSPRRLAALVVPAVAALTIACSGNAAPTVETTPVAPIASAKPLAVSQQAADVSVVTAALANAPTNVASVATAVPAAGGPPAVPDAPSAPQPAETVRGAVETEIPPSAVAAVEAPRFAVQAGYDATDATPGDGVCADAAGICTLRAAIQEANASSTAATVELAPGVYTLALLGTGEDAAASGDLDITSDLTLMGAGEGQTVIDASGLDRALQVHGGAVTVAKLTIRGGATAQENGGAILSAGALVLSAVELTGNAADGHGGAVAVFAGSLELRGVVVQGNHSAGNGGGIWLNSGSLLVASSSITSNSADDEGGGLSTSGDASVTDSIVLDNDGGAGGGGIHNGGALTITRVTIDGNRDAGGGGLLNESGSLVVRDSSVRGNDGGGIVVVGGAIELVSTTVNGNLIDGQSIDIRNDPFSGGAVILGFGTQVGVCEDCGI